MIFRNLSATILSFAALASVHGGGFLVDAFHTPPSRSFRGIPQIGNSPATVAWSMVSGEDNYNDGTESPHSESILNTRREVLANAASTFLLGVSTLGISSPSFAEDAAAVTASEGLVSSTKLASLLKAIPTFAIVDARGVPYFVVGEDAKLTSYFFISYGEAKRILDVAISSSDNAIKEGRKDLLAKKKAKGEEAKLTKEEEEELGTNPWKSARITSVPLDLAVSLASKGKLAGAYFRLAPSESDIEEALALDGSEDLPEGKVPLFYVEDMKISSASGNENNATVSPLYFEKDQLLTAWRNQNENIGKQSTPDIKVTELFATLTEMVRPGGTDSDLKSLEFVPPLDSKSKADKIIKGEKEPFRLGERLIVL